MADALNRIADPSQKLNIAQKLPVAARERPGIMRPYHDWAYERRKAYAALEQLLTETWAKEVIELLGEISSSGERSWQERFLALDTLGDIGVPAESDLLETIDKAIRASKDDSLLALLTSVRVRTGREAAGDIAALRQRWLKNDERLEVRQRCLEPLLLEGKVAIEELPALLAILDDLGKDGQAMPPEMQRFCSVVGSSVQGRALLIGEIRRKSGRPWVALAMATAVEAIGREDAQWAEFLAICRLVAVDPKEYENMALAAVYFLSSRANDSDAVATFISAAVTSGRASLSTLGFNYAMREQRVLDHVDALAPVMESRDSDLRRWLFRALRSDDRPLRVSKKATELIGRGLQDEDAGVRSVAMLVVMDQLTMNKMEARELEGMLQRIVDLAVSARAPRELRNALFIIELVSGGGYRIDGAPRKSQGYLATDGEADKWWLQNGQNTKREALAWASRNGYKVAY